MRRTDLTAGAETPQTAAAGIGPERREDQAARIDAEIAACRRRIRGWRPYYHYRRLVKRLDALPGSLALGRDFDVLAEKR